MFNFAKNEGQKPPKCLVTHSKLSSYIDHDRPPNKKRPFNTILHPTYSHTFDLLLPEPAAATFKSSTIGDHLAYLKVHMKLQEIISGDFFNTYIKTSGSNILMLSEGRMGIDRIFSLREGILRLEVDKPTWEKLGLEGKSICTEGRKHIKARFAIEIDLRRPNMVHGEKGFERLVWAFKNVLDRAVTWLFVDLTKKDDPTAAMENGPIKEFAPTPREVQPEVHEIQDGLVPVWPEKLESEDYAEAAELLEWISLAMMGSARLKKGDGIDPYLSRYQVPSSLGEAKPQRLVRFRWRGLVHPEFVQKVFLAALKACGDQWMAISASALDAEAYTILIHDGQCVTWQYKD